MKQYLNDYIKEVEKSLDKKVTKDDLDNLNVKILFFQHERLIHLLVTLSNVIFMILFFILSFLVHISFMIIFFITLIFLLFYVIHYFRLENGVQYLYKQYDEMLKRVKK